MSASATPSATPDEDDPPGGAIVQHYRVDPSGPLKRSLGLGALIITVGALVMASALLLSHRGRAPGSARRVAASDAAFSAEVDARGEPIARPSAPLELALGLFGLGCVVLGGATTIVGLRRVLSEESYLALRTDGAYFRRGAERSLVRWDDVEDVRWDAAAGAVRFERHDGSVWARPERFADADGPSIARRAAEIRRKALFGLLR